MLSCTEPLLECLKNLPGANTVGKCEVSVFAKSCNTYSDFASHNVPSRVIELCAGEFLCWFSGPAVWRHPRKS